MLETLMAHFGYPVVFLGTFVEGETFILLGGVLAQEGYLSFRTVVIVAALGALAGDVFYFALGRIYGRRLLEKSRRARRLLPWLERFIARYHALWIFGVRYLYGMRWLAAALAGSSDLGVSRFATMALPACLLWALVIGVLGRVLGETLERILGHLKHYELYVVLLVLAVGIAYGTVARMRERRLERPTQ